ncbi:MAG: hypothetical protein AABZ30_05130 [Myxococcota bacterium]
MRAWLAILPLLACEEARRPPAVAAEAAAAPAPVPPGDLALCEAVRDSAPERCGDEACRERYEILRVLFKTMLSAPRCSIGSKDFQAICNAATDRKLWECQKVALRLRPLCDALASADGAACHPGGGRECVDLFQAAAGVSRGDFAAIDRVRDPALRVAAKATLGRIDCAEELRRALGP